MGKRPKNPWRLAERKGTPNLEVQFSHGGKRFRIATGCSDVAAASSEAQRIYTDIVSGNPQARENKRQVGRVATETLEKLFATWLVHLEGLLDKETVDTYAIYVRAHFVPFFGSLPEITTPRGADYVRARLAKVQTKTVRKELSALRGFLSWAHERGHLDEPVEIRPLPKRATGTANIPRNKQGGWIDLTEFEARKIIEYLPAYGRLKRPIRAYYIVLWETALRPETVCSLVSPLDYKVGSDSLVIRDEADKARFGRELPLTPGARAALDSVCPTEGHLFGRSPVGAPPDFRNTLRAAAKKAGLEPDRANRISDYDFRHGRITHLVAESGDLLGAGYLAGHKHATTTAVYAHARHEHAARMLDKIAAKREEQ